MARPKRNRPANSRKPAGRATRNERQAATPPPDRAIRFASNPGALVMVVLMGLVVLGGHLAARYIDDPALIPGPWRIVVAVAAAVVVFLAVSTLTQLTTVLMLPVTPPSTRSFLVHIGEFSAVGAILGTALGFRMGEHLFVDAGRDPARYGFPDLLGTISDGITVLTLVTVALCWRRSAVLAFELVQAMRQSGRLPGLASYTPLLLLVVGNYIGVQAAAFAYQLLVR
ncbi:hypothetical protein Q2K19_05130 [Micromonospora soli]|uniref:hypothetical protein n=1 Tax=Micromonospora sp. NBRC 110009 TaxID=3061627 RepID=UPI00267114DE|nr:hypothetical protein [Micromonospora sp. NBRC 110009]WKT99876.1 hypothetical protein Q2K19_05130 [Micromonospora sp. NBRC 110009]